MQSPLGEFEASIEVKQSKFIAFLLPKEQELRRLEELRTIHPKANHIVQASRWLNEHSQIVEASSDDGEPKGCAGIPVLNVLRGNSLVNCSLLIVRYFGGTKLGTGGMVRAYTQSAQAVVGNASFSPYQKEESFFYDCSYSALSIVEYLLKTIEITNIKKDFVADGVKLEVVASQEKIARLKEELKKRL